MARMIPASLENQDNPGEKRVFEALQQMPDKWVVRSNLRCSGISTSNDQKSLQEVESDFVVLIPEKGLVFLEVKSSKEFCCSNSDQCKETAAVTYQCRNAEWTRITRGVSQKTTSPFQQVWLAKDKQMRFLCQALYNNEDYKKVFPGVYAHLVVYPQGNIREGRMPLQSPCVVVTAKEMGHLQNKIEALVDLYPQAPKLDDVTFQKIVKYFEEEVHIEAVSTDPDTLEKELKKLTDKQKEIAGRLLTEDSNFKIYGCCGSGKTMLAVWLLKHKVGQNKKVLYLCYNRLLAASLRIKLGPAYEIKTIDQLIRALAKQANVQYEPERKEAVLEACLNMPGFSFPTTYDVIIIDEAQDIRSVDLFDSIIGYLSATNGRQYVFADPKQNIYHNNIEKLPYEEWEAAELTLDKNCRNTKKVAEYVKEIKDTAGSVFEDAPQGIAPQILPVRQDSMNLLKQTVNNILGGREYQWPASSIAILVLDKASLNSLKDQTFLNGVGTTVYNSEKGNDEEVLRQWYDNDSKKILVSTVHAFKGLEADIVILYNFNSGFNVGNDGIDTLAYVGASRPHGALYIIPADKISREYAEQFLRSTKE